MEQSYSYKSVLDTSERIQWRVDDLIGGERQLDFSRPFLPESLARVQELTCLDESERRVLNQIRGHDYLYVFGLVEEFILPFVLNHASGLLHGEDYPVRALLQFASEEAKHIHLFKEFRDNFLRNFGTDCDVIGPPQEIAKAVLAHHPLAVAMVILQIEWMTQKHFTESVRDNTGLDPVFRDLLRHHWMEEAQHAKLDTLMVESLAASCTPDEIDRAFEDYGKIAALLDGGLMQQVEFDLEAFERATGSRLDDERRAEIRESQRQATRWTFLGSGITHDRFLATVERVRPGARAKLESIAPAYC